MDLLPRVGAPRFGRVGLVRHGRTPLVVLPDDAELAAGSGHYELGTDTA